MFKKWEILQLSHNAVPGTPPGNITYYINHFGRVTSDHSLTSSEFSLVKRTANPDARDRMRQWPKWKSRAINLVISLVSGVLGYLV